MRPSDATCGHTCLNTPDSDPESEKQVMDNSLQAIHAQPRAAAVRAAQQGACRMHRASKVAT
eukprot:353607-Chlamydomonas_euryale.AAC.3